MTYKKHAARHDLLTLDEVCDQLRKQVNITDEMLSACVKSVVCMRKHIDVDLLCKQLQEALDDSPVKGEFIAKMIKLLNIPAESMETWLFEKLNDQM